jgi:hypothetical protein
MLLAAIRTCPLAAMKKTWAITERDRIRWSMHRHAAPNAESVLPVDDEFRAARWYRTTGSAAT